MRGTRPGKAAIGGIRLPFESPSAGDGYCASGECITRQMTEAERQRYGKAEPNGKQPFVWRKKGDDEMSRLDVAREKLGKEKYLELKKAGMLDGEIMRKYFGSVWTDVLNTLKTEWGLIGALPNPGNAKKKEEVNQAVKVDIEKPKAEEIAHNEAVEKQKKLCEKLDALAVTAPPELKTINWADNPKECMEEIKYTRRAISVIELLVEVELLKNRIDTDQARIDYISGILEKTMVEA